LSLSFVHEGDERPVEKVLWVVMNMTCALLQTSGLDEKYRPLAVNQATYLKYRLTYRALGDRLPYEMVYGYILDLSSMRIIGSRVQAIRSPSEREGKLGY